QRVARRIIARMGRTGNVKPRAASPQGVLLPGKWQFVAPAIREGLCNAIALSSFPVPPGCFCALGVLQRNLMHGHSLRCSMGLLVPDQGGVSDLHRNLHSNYVAKPSGRGARTHDGPWCLVA